MHFAIIFAALAFTALASPRPNPIAAPQPQGVSASLAPASTPEGCASTYMNGTPFQIGIVNASITATTRKIKRQTNPTTQASNTLMLRVQNGILTDQDGRQGYIASNTQLQFDPVVPQAGALYTSGFSVCSNGTLALASAVWYECLSSDEFYNLYTQPTGGVCYPAFLAVIASAPATSTMARSAETTTSAATGSISQLASASASGQSAFYSPEPYATFTTVLSSSVSAVTQIADGQVQAPTAASIMYQTIAVVSQIADGQIQAPTSASGAYYTASVAPVPYSTGGLAAAPVPTNGTLAPFNPNAASAVAVLSARLLAVVVGAVGFGAFMI